MQYFFFQNPISYYIYGYFDTCVLSISSLSCVNYIFSNYVHPVVACCSYTCLAGYFNSSNRNCDQIIKSVTISACRGNFKKCRNSTYEQYMQPRMCVKKDEKKIKQKTEPVYPLKTNNYLEEITLNLNLKNIKQQSWNCVSEKEREREIHETSRFFHTQVSVLKGMYIMHVCSFTKYHIICTYTYM